MGTTWRCVRYSEYAGKGLYGMGFRAATTYHARSLANSLLHFAATVDKDKSASIDYRIEVRIRLLVMLQEMRGDL